MDTTLEALLASANSQTIREFCSSYADRHEDFAHLLAIHLKEKSGEPAEPVHFEDYTRLIDKCFSNFAKKPYNRWLNYEEDNLDWGAIGYDIRQIINRLRDAAAQGHHMLVLCVALSLLDRIATAYHDEGAYDSSFFTPDNTHIADLLDLLEKTFLSRKISNSIILRSLDELERINATEAYAVLNARDISNFIADCRKEFSRS